MTIIKLTTTRDESVHINADYIKLILTNTADETVIVFDTEMPNFDRNYKETPEEIAKLIEKADPLCGVCEQLYRIEYRLCGGLS